jgi:hypothetical protein
MTDAAAVDRFILSWGATGGSELANTQSFINELCALVGVEPPRGSRVDDAENSYVFERRVFEDNGDGGRPPLGGPIWMLVHDWLEALGFGGPDSELVFDGRLRLCLL